MANPEVLPTLRRTRFVCVSDTHNATPSGAFKLPKGDVLIHAGDLTNQGSYSELKKAVQWIKEADFESKIVIADGPHTTFKIFGSPFSPAKGLWAFGYGPNEAAQIWDKIPLDSDIVVTHTPPKYHCDESKERRAAGCEALRTTLWRVRPRLVVCGHVHEGRGAERVRWDLGLSNIKYKESGVDKWIDPAQDNNKMSVVDLCVRRGSSLQNDGSVGDCLEDELLPGITTTSQALDIEPLNQPSPYQHSSKRSRSKEKASDKVSTNRGISRVTTQLLAIHPDTVPPATLGQGGIPPSIRCDLPALSGRLGRQETCIVNAAIMASSWPHNSHEGRGRGKKFNKPIVVDVDLPIWKRGPEL